MAVQYTTTDVPVTSIPDNVTESLPDSTFDTSANVSGTEAFTITLRFDLDFAVLSANATALDEVRQGLWRERGAFGWLVGWLVEICCCV